VVKIIITGFNIVICGDSQSPVIILNRWFGYIKQIFNTYILYKASYFNVWTRV